MKTLMFIVVLLALGIAGFGYYRGWFAVSSNSADQTPSATITVDKAKFHADEKKATDDVKGIGQAAKNKIGAGDGKAKEPQPQP